MEISIIEITVILFTHWIADFICQSREIAENKSKDMKALTNHVLVYTFIWGIPAFYFFHTRSSPKEWLLFLILTFVTHWLTDYIISKITAVLWKSEEVWLFFVVIGFDQLLHYMQLFVTYSILK